MADDNTAWFSLNGQNWHVELGSPGHEHLLAEGAEEIDEPAEAKPARSKGKPADKGDEA